MENKLLRPLAVTFFVKDFPSTFWFTGIIDSLFTIMYVVFALRGGIRFSELFLPVIPTDNTKTGHGFFHATELKSGTV
jgi:hypothetical protein